MDQEIKIELAESNCFADRDYEFQVHNLLDRRSYAWMFTTDACYFGVSCFSAFLFD